MLVKSGQVVVPFIVNPWLEEGTKGYDIRHTSAQTISENVYIMPTEDSDSFYPKPLVMDEGVRNCVERRSLSHIFRHLETKPKPLLYAQSVDIDANFIPFLPEDYSDFWVSIL